jgi:glutaredoxin 3
VENLAAVRRRPRRGRARPAALRSWLEPPMSPVVIYTKTYCPYCSRAKALMAEKGVSFEEINLDEHPERRREMISRAQGRSTVPQIFIDGEGVGGSDDLYELERRGKLDELLGRTA